MPAIELTKEQKKQAIQDIIEYFARERGEEIGDLAGTIILDFIVEKIGQFSTTSLINKIIEAYGSCKKQ